MPVIKPSFLPRNWAFESLLKDQVLSNFWKVYKEARMEGRNKSLLQERYQKPAV